MLEMLGHAEWEQVSQDEVCQFPHGRMVAVLHGGIVTVGPLHSVYNGSIYLQSDRPLVRRHAGRFPAAVVSVAKEID